MKKSGRQSIIFFTNDEHGQANVIITVARHLACQEQNIDVHLASFGDLELRMQRLNQELKDRFQISRTSDAKATPVDSPVGVEEMAQEEYTTQKQDPPQVIFHTLPGPSMASIIKEHGIAMPHAPGLGAVHSYRNLNNAILGWTNTEYLAIHSECLKIMQSLSPAAVVLDPGMWHAIDACRTLTLSYIVLTPSSLKEVAGSLQPRWTMFAKYPLVGSGYSFPLPWTKVMSNFWLALRLIGAMVSTGHIQRLNKCRREAGMQHKFPMLDMYKKENLYLSPSMTIIDYPMLELPNNIIGCGPIVSIGRSVAECDPKLDAWLKRKDTVLINLGTHFNSEEMPAVELAKGIDMVLNTVKNVQILWKLKFDWQNSNAFKKVLSGYIEAGDVLIVNWLDVDPVSILQTGCITTAVHHGGANSFYEACW